MHNSVTFWGIKIAIYPFALLYNEIQKLFWIRNSMSVSLSYIYLFVRKRKDKQSK